MERFLTSNEWQWRLARTINLSLRMVDEGMEDESDLFAIDRWGAAKITRSGFGAV